MDYFAEIAECPDIDEALGRLGHASSYPEGIRHMLDGHYQLSRKYPGVWRAVLINAFHLDPTFAAKVWRTLASCRSERERLARDAEARSPFSWSKLLRTPLGLAETSDETELDFNKAPDHEIEQVRNVLNRPYPGPAFIEKLVNLDELKTKTAVHRMNAVQELISNPDTVWEIANKHAVPVPFSMVHDQELDQIDTARLLRGEADPASKFRATSTGPGPRGAPLRRALDQNLVGLAFSGGGIRSATFNLGVLQALAKLDVLRHCDYLSTVSGGSYIGAWFTAWMLREAQGQTAQHSAIPQKNAALRQAAHTHDLLRQRLSPSHSPSPLDSRVRPIRYLREFSNYLTPQMGFFSADTWTMVAIYIRNVLLNWLVLIPLIGAVLLTPRLVFGLTELLVTTEWSELIVLPLLIAVPLIVLLPNLRRASPPPKPLAGAVGSRQRRDDARGKVPWYARQGTIQIGVVVPFLLAACVTAVRHRELLEHAAATDRGTVIMNVAITAGLVFFIYLAVIHWFGKFYRSYRSKNQAVVALTLATFGAAAAAFGLFWLLGHLANALGTGSAGHWMAIAFGTPLTLAAYSFIVVIQLGLLGAEFPDEQREWWSRLRAWTLIYSLGWAALFTGAIWVPQWIEWLAATTSAGAVAAWAVSTFVGIKAGGSGAAAEGRPTRSGSAPAVRVPPSLKARALRLAALVAPYIFVVGLVALVSVSIHKLLLRWWPANGSDYWSSISAFSIGPPTLSDPLTYFTPSLLLVASAMLAVSLFVSWRIGVNEFSMHHFYRNRLVRCYLGASHWLNRKADWFTGFDSEDDIRLSAFDHVQPGVVDSVPYPGPYPIINATLNLVAGEDLAWQERKATSFVFTPKYCGYDVDRALLQKDKGDNWPDAYAPTRQYVAEGVGPTLGTAMAISGAAASPNMGMLTTPAMAFLMTVFNARLGWWLPNTRRKGLFRWNRSGPRLGINYTAIELFGLTDDEKKFVNLSDGGHFENLGVYELIRRGCRYVILCDAGQDGDLGLEDLGNLIRKCRTDFGVEIDISTDSIRDRTRKGWSTSHCVVGTIHYLAVPKSTGGSLKPDPAGRIPHEVGLLIYLKPSISGDEPFDILEYYQRVPEFPHESTVEQWFNESQFESYRRLGLHVGETTFRRAREKPELPIGSTKNNSDTIQGLFNYLAEFWHAASPKLAERATAHAEEYSRILESLRKQQNLNTLDAVLFPKARGQTISNRDEFYVCNALIQLMENVYNDLELEQYYAHPSVGGWMSVFREWAKQPEFQSAWAICKSTYNGRFQNFYEDRLR
jgi:hypothetical protein